VSSSAFTFSCQVKLEIILSYKLALASFFSRIYVDVIELLFIRVCFKATNGGEREEDAYDFSLSVEDDGTKGTCKCQTYPFGT